MVNNKNKANHSTMFEKGNPFARLSVPKKTPIATEPSALGTQTTSAPPPASSNDDFDADPDHLSQRLASPAASQDANTLADPESSEVPSSSSKDKHSTERNFKLDFTLLDAEEGQDPRANIAENWGLMAFDEVLYYIHDEVDGPRSEVPLPELGKDVLEAMVKLSEVTGASRWKKAIDDVIKRLADLKYITKTYSVKPKPRPGVDLSNFITVEDVEKVFAETVQRLKWQYEADLLSSDVDEEEDTASSHPPSSEPEDNADDAPVVDEHAPGGHAQQVPNGRTNAQTYTQEFFQNRTSFAPSPTKHRASEEDSSGPIATAATSTNVTTPASKPKYTFGSKANVTFDPRLTATNTQRPAGNDKFPTNLLARTDPNAIDPESGLPIIATKPRPRLGPSYAMSQVRGVPTGDLAGSLEKVKAASFKLETKVSKPKRPQASDFLEEYRDADEREKGRKLAHTQPPPPHSPPPESHPDPNTGAHAHVAAEEEEDDGVDRHAREKNGRSSQAYQKGTEFWRGWNRQGQAQKEPARLTPAGESTPQPQRRRRPSKTNSRGYVLEQEPQLHRQLVPRSPHQSAPPPLSPPQPAEPVASVEPTAPQPPQETRQTSAEAFRQRRRRAARNKRRAAIRHLNLELEATEAECRSNFNMQNLYFFLGGPESAKANIKAAGIKRKVAALEDEDAEMEGEWE